MHKIYKQIQIFLVIVASFSQPVFSGEAAVTYEFSMGRFGDNLLTYLHAKWLSFQYDIPLVYRPFKYSSDLVLDDMEMHYGNYQGQRYHLDFSQMKSKAPYLFVCPYFPECPWELKVGQYQHFSVDWKNQEFRKIACDMISPKSPLILTYPPQHTVNIAIHIREGGGYDDYDKLHYYNALKAPPMSFYIESLLRVLEHFQDTPIYCFIFTDALHPETLVEEVKSNMPPGVQIEFDYRRQNNHHDSYVLEDFFSLFNFDILIRGESNYSIIPSLIKDYAIVCFPVDFSLNQDSSGKWFIKIEKICIQLNQEACQKIISE